jgi:leader peptidase (prepilin peptidase)/N-methyltransferase
MGDLSVRVFVVIFGCLLGSFLNVVRYRLPRRKGIVGGRSICPKCKTSIALYDNIPVVSYIVLKGKCRHCAWRIPLTYPIIEIAAGVSFLLVWMQFGWPQAAAYWVLTALLIACAGIDFDRGIIPDRLTLPGIILGIVFSLTLLRGADPVGEALLRSGLGLVVGGGSLLLVGLLYKVVRKVEGMGGGDVKLMAMVGAFLDFRLALLTIFIGSVLGGIVGIGVMRKSSKGMKASVPFGVFLSPAAIAAMLWGDSLINAYLDLLR